MIDRILEVVGRLGGAVERLADRLIDVIVGGRPQVTPIPTER